MSNAEAQTIDGYARRSDRTVMIITIVIALGGALADGASHLLPSLVAGASVGLLWGLWIPLCFLVIPPVHYVCRRLVALQARLDALEKRAEAGAAAELGAAAAARRP